VKINGLESGNYQERQKEDGKLRWGVRQSRFLVGGLPFISRPGEDYFGFPEYIRQNGVLVSYLVGIQDTERKWKEEDKLKIAAGNKTGRTVIGVKECLNISTN
jgi:hypothetical protein